MPRTKRVKSKMVPTNERKLEYNALMKDVHEEMENFLDGIEVERDRMKQCISQCYYEMKISAGSWQNKTLEELAMQQQSYSSSSSALMISSIVASSTLTKPPANHQQTTNGSKRSKGDRDDEGYLTAGSRSSSTSRTSRAQKTTSKSTLKRSQSLQRTRDPSFTRALANSTLRKAPNKEVDVADKDRGKGSGSTTRQSRSRNTKVAMKNTRRSRSANSDRNNLYETPANKHQPEFGFITPKVKINTPQAILRRPDIGEIAYSVQGSPILTTETKSSHANVNIPLKNGRIVSIQPYASLRKSQLPAMDNSILEQIKVLQDNLTKVIEASTRANK